MSNCVFKKQRDKDKFSNNKKYAKLSFFIVTTMLANSFEKQMLNILRTASVTK